MNERNLNEGHGVQLSDNVEKRFETDIYIYIYIYISVGQSPIGLQRHWIYLYIYYSHTFGHLEFINALQKRHPFALLTTSSLLTEAAHRRLVVHVPLSVSQDRTTGFFGGGGGSFAKICENQPISFVMSVRLSCSPSERNNSVPTERIFMKFGNFVTVRRSVENIGLSLKPDNDNRYFT